MTPTLSVSPRETTKKARTELLHNGKVPAILYGPKQAATAIALERVEFERVFKEAGESTVIEVTGLEAKHEVLVHDVDTDPVLGAIRHVDLYVPEKGKKVEVNVPLEFTGVSPAEKELGGTLIKVLHELAVEALPKALPHQIEVNVEGLKDFETQIHVRDIQLPAGVTAVTEGDEVVALVQEAIEEVVDEPVEETDMSQIEVEKRGKEESEGSEEEDA